MKKNYCFFLILLVVGWGKASGQSHDFNIYIANQKTGSMNMSLTHYSNGNLLVDIKMDFKAVSLGQNRVQYFASAYFRKSVLTDSESLVEYNKVLKEKCNVKWIKDKYQIQRKDENPEDVDSKIGFVFEQLYLKEPLNVSSVFSIRYGTFLELKMLSPGVYTVKMPLSGSTNFYYQNGKFVKSETSGNLQQMTITPRQR